MIISAKKADNCLKPWQILLRTSPIQNQINMFQPLLMQIVHDQHPLVQLSKEIDWSFFEDEFEKFYSDTGRPAHPIRRMVGFLILKQLYNLSDENAVMRWVENPYWQFFTGEDVFQYKAPFDPSELVHFRKRIGEEGAEKIFQMSIRLHCEGAKEKEVVVDTTVQEKNITYPTDTKLQKKIIERCVKTARKEGIQLNRTYRREVKNLLLAMRFSRHPKNRNRAQAARRRMKTIAGRVLRDLERKLMEQDLLTALHEKDFAFYRQVLMQKRNDKNKIYSLHEPGVSCIVKGKEHKPFEFGCKASLASTKRNGIIVGAKVFEGNPYDGDTLAPTVDQVERLTGSRPDAAITDRGYRGRKNVGTTEVITPNPGNKNQTPYQKRKARNRFRRRAAIEPRIAHLKHDFRMNRNYLRGHVGDAINLLMAAAAWNFRKWIMALPDFLSFLCTCLTFYTRSQGIRDPFHPQKIGFQSLALISPKRVCFFGSCF